MQKLKNGVKRSQLWQIISSWNALYIVFYQKLSPSSSDKVCVVFMWASSCCVCKRELLSTLAAFVGLVLNQWDVPPLILLLLLPILRIYNQHKLADMPTSFWQDTNIAIWLFIGWQHCNDSNGGKVSLVAFLWPFPSTITWSWLTGYITVNRFCVFTHIALSN